MSTWRDQFTTNNSTREDVIFQSLAGRGDKGASPVGDGGMVYVSVSFGLENGQHILLLV